MNILIVDDDEIDRALIKRELNSSLQNKYQVKEANSVTRGLKLLETELFDVILLDYHMPEINGVEMILNIRARPHLGNTAIVMISASQDTKLSLECIDAGAQDFIPKADISYLKLHQALIHSKKRFDIEKRMHENYLAVKNLAEKDPLTGILNRYSFQENLEFMINNSNRTGLSVGMLAFDLDNFKHINDTLGHHAGDQLLIEIVTRVKKCLRMNDGFSRLGGDEFTITLANIHSVEEVHNTANRILRAFNPPFLIEGKSLHCTISIGAALYPENTTKIEELIKCADIAMYRAKQAGKNGIRFYERDYQNQFNHRLKIQKDVNEILKESLFRLFYQPIICANSNKIVGVEALIRWPDTPISYKPKEFIPAISETLLIHHMGDWVINTAIAQLAKWQKQFDSQLTMSINLSPEQLQEEGLSDAIINVIKKYKVETDTVIFEITENALTKDNDIVSQALKNIASAGCKIALDGFGTGVSSLTHLSTYPISIVKLDKSLQETPTQTTQRKIMYKAVVPMLKTLNLMVIAKGIETEQQLVCSKGLDIDQLQGHLLAIPMAATNMTDELCNQKKSIML